MVAFMCAILVRILPASNFTFVLSLIVFANILLAIFNLVPIPPLDGSKILYALIPNNEAGLKFKMVFQQYGFIILLFFIFFFFQLISPLINIVYRLFVGG